MSFHRNEVTVLSLTAEQVDALITVLRAVGGNPAHTLRRHTDDVLDTLEAVRPHRSADKDDTLVGHVTFIS